MHKFYCDKCEKDWHDDRCVSCLMIDNSALHKQVAELEKDLDFALAEIGKWSRRCGHLEIKLESYERGAAMVHESGERDGI